MRLFGYFKESVKELNESLILKEAEEATPAEGEQDDFQISQSNQEHTSAKTSINSSRVPAIFKLVKFAPKTMNLDYGGGRFDIATEFLAEQDVTNLIYDPYNRTAGHNAEVISAVKANNGADTVTCSNVLNVIKEPEVRLEVITNIHKLLKPMGVAYFTVYEGTGAGNSGETKAGYQLNRKTEDYVEEISRVFRNVRRKGKLIVAIKWYKI
jgi:hypothetical protein